MFLPPQPAQAYLHLTLSVGSTQTPLKWNTPRVRWFATERGVPGVTASQFQTEVASAFATWEAVPTASIAFQFVGFTSAVPFEDDGISVFGFEAEPELDRVLGATSFVVDTVTGEIVESDVFFNSIFTWSTAPAGDAGALRSAVGGGARDRPLRRARSFSAWRDRDAARRRPPRAGLWRRDVSDFAWAAAITADRQLQPDDIAGVSDLYPDGGLSRRHRRGERPGRAQRRAGVIGAHVVAFNPRTGALVGGFSLGQGGAFQIAGLTPRRARHSRRAAGRRRRRQLLLASAASTWTFR